jgi:hypothetical protein
MDATGRPCWQTFLLKAAPPAAGAVTSATAGSVAAGIGEPASSRTPDEHMALFAKELKENDWGH